MKKIIAIILAAACIFAFASCGDGNGSGGGIEGYDNPIEAIVAMYALSEPTKIVTNYTTQLGNITLSGEEILVTGSIDGKIAPIYEYWYEDRPLERQRVGKNQCRRVRTRSARRSCGDPLGLIYLLCKARSADITHGWTHCGDSVLTSWPCWHWQCFQYFY